MKQRMVGNEAIITLNNIVMDYLNEFNMRPKPKEVGIPLTQGEKAAQAMMEASSIDEPEYEDVVAAVSKTISIMKNIEQDLVSNDLSKYINRRRTVEQINSIMAISRSYPDNAIKRLKGLRPKIQKIAV
jgi:hypothetical protein